MRSISSCSTSFSSSTTALSRSPPLIIPSKDLGIIGNQHMSAEMVIRINNQVNTMLFIGKGDFLPYNVIVTVFLQLFDTGFFYGFNEHVRAATHDRRLLSI